MSSKSKNRGGLQGRPSHQQPITAQINHSSTWAAPLPPPQAIDQFAVTYPDAPRIIFESFEREGESRRANQAALLENQKYELETQRLVAKRTTFSSMAATFMAGLSLLGFLGAGFYLIIIGKEASGWASVGTAAALIFWGKRQVDKQK